MPPGLKNFYTVLGLLFCVLMHLRKDGYFSLYDIKRVVLYNSGEECLLLGTESLYTSDMFLF